VRLVPQGSQVAPLAPQALSFSFASATQLPLLQQPVQEPPPQLHTPLAEQVSPAPQALQVAPPLPHSFTFCDV
jgi:hypothetical protein